MESLNRFATTAKRITGSVSYVAVWISAIFSFLLAILIFCDVIGRYLLNQPIYGADDFTELALVVIVFFAMAFTQVEKGHVRVELIISRLSHATQITLNTFTSFFSAAIMAMISWRLGVYSVEAFRDPNAYQTLSLGIPIGPFLLLASLGALLLCLVLIVDFLGFLSEVVSR
jgi:TRAP-type C4-dicarboxylate transport system permease small subunit